MPSYVHIERNYNPEIIVTRWGRWSRVLAEKIRKALLHYMRYYGIQAVRRYFPKGGKGTLEAQLKIYDHSTLYRIVIGIGTGSPDLDNLIRILEYGSPPHQITPRKAKALRFISEWLRFYKGVGGVLPAKIMGEVVYAKSVQHPGNRAYRMFQMGMADIKPEIRVVINRVIKEAIGELIQQR